MRHIILLWTLSCWVLLSLGASTVPVWGQSVPAPPPPVKVPCRDVPSEIAEGDVFTSPCEPGATPGKESSALALRHEEEQGDFRWHVLTPQEQDQRLWYYPGAPRPLWGY